MRLGVIDLGTNTFNLLIVDVFENGIFREVYRSRKFIHLAEEGIKTIGLAPYQRGIEALNHFALQLMHYQVRKFKVKGTAALRTASNGAAFLEEVKAKTNIQISTITGDEEARLIYLGVREAVPLTATPVLIIDVGGGSVEFIICNKDKWFWAKSFPIGVAVLYKNYHHSEPISTNEINALEQFLTNTLKPLKNAIEGFNIKTLIGASGTFDVFAHALPIRDKYKHAVRIEFSPFQPLYQKVIRASYEERLALPEVPKERKKLIVVALILIDFVLRMTGIEDIVISNFAMKEGMIQELLTDAKKKNIEK